MALQIFGQDGPAPSGHNYLKVSPDGALYIVATDERFNSLSGAIVTNRNNITYNDIDINYLSGQIDALSGGGTQDLTYISGVIDTNTTNITSNDVDINYLSAAIDALPAGQSLTYISGAIDTNTTNITSNDSDITYLSGQIDNFSTEASGISMARVAGSTYSTVQHMQDIFHSPGIITGGAFTDNLSGTVNIAAGTGLIRGTNDSTAVLLWTDWNAATNLTLTDISMNWIYVEYNSGSPQIVASVTERTDVQTNLLLGTIYRNGNTLHMTSGTRPVVSDHALNMILRLKAVAPFARESGGTIGETGTRNISITAGQWWEGLTNFSTAAFDSSGVDTYTEYYRDGIGGWTATNSKTQINNLNYDDGSGTLASLTVNRYGVHWIYIDTDGDIYDVFGRGNYLLAQAEAANAPGEIPPFFAESHAKLIGKIIIQQGASVFTEVLSVFDTQIDVSSPTDHGGLIGLADDDHTQYILVNGTRAFTGTVSGITPTVDQHLTTKGYVDNADNILQTQITTNDSDISYLSGQIDNNTTEITNNDNDISYLSGIIDNNTGVNTYLSGQIDINTTNITSNDVDIDYLSGAIDTNSTNISNNTTNITSNDSDITYLSAAIDAIPSPIDYSGDINYLSGQIDINTTNITSNYSDITYLSGTIDNIDTVRYDNISTTVEANSAAWSAGGDLTYISGSIDINTTNITSLSSEILTADKTVTFTSGMTAAQIQTEIDAQPRTSGKDFNGIIFEFEDGTYTLDNSLEFAGFECLIFIRSATVGSDTLHTTQTVNLDFTTNANNGSQLYINFCGDAEVEHLKITLRSNQNQTGIGWFYSGGRARYNYIVQDGTKPSASVAFLAYGTTNVEVLKTYVSNTANGIEAENGAILYSRENSDTGTAPNYGLVAEKGAILTKYSSVQPAGITANEVNLTGGNIIDKVVNLDTTDATPTAGQITVFTGTNNDVSGSLSTISDSGLSGGSILNITPWLTSPPTSALIQHDVYLVSGVSSYIWKYWDGTQLWTVG